MNNANKYILLVLFMYGFCYTEMARMFAAESNVPFNAIYPLMMLALTFIASLAIKLETCKTIQPLVRFVIITYILSLISSLAVPFPAKYYYFTLLLPAVSGVFIYKMLLSGVSEKMFFLCIGCVFCVLVGFYFYNYQNNMLLEVQFQNNAAYTILYLLPLILCFKNKYIRLLAIIITAVALLYSLKRGGTLAFSIALIAYLYVNMFVIEKGKNRFSYILLAAVGILGAYELYISYFSEQGSILFNRFNDDGGSGRDEVYKVAFDLISQNGIIDYIFGHGYNAMRYDSPLQLSAHNDYLEYLYDYGIIGLCLLLSVIYRYIKYTVELLKTKSFYAGPALFALIIMIVNSMVAHVFFYEWYLLIFSIFFGYIYAIPKIEFNNEQNYIIK